MSDPYYISGPAPISFSGGRTSAYMLHEIIRAHGGALPDDVIPTFANTGREREDTLRFVHECGVRWGVYVRWLEWRDNESRFEEVGFNSASRNGEPFERLISKKQMPPNWQARFCTQILKVETMTSFARSLGWTPGAYAEVIGLRADEPMRVFRMLERNETDGRRCVAPLASRKIAKRHVMEFWRRQPFDLALAPGEGNCDLCFLKGRKTRMVLMRRWPQSAKWWIDREIETGGFFDRRDRYIDLLSEVARTPEFEFDVFDDEHDVECGLHCGASAEMDEA